MLYEYFINLSIRAQKYNCDYASHAGDYELVSWSLTSIFSTNMAISETKETTSNIIDKLAIQKKLSAIRRHIFIQGGAVRTT